MYTFQVEDGSGVVGATSYASISQSDSFAEFWGYSDWLLLDDADKEKLLMKASSFMDSQFKWRSHMLKKDQGLLFPRKTFVDSENREVKGIPLAVIEAVSEFAILLENHSVEDLENVKTLIKQSYGDSSEEYLGGYQDGSTPFVAAYNRIASKLKHLGYGGNAFKQAELIRG